MFIFLAFYKLTFGPYPVLSHNGEGSKKNRTNFPLKKRGNKRGLVFHSRRRYGRFDHIFRRQEEYNRGKPAVSGGESKRQWLLSG
jgi:hypothetical protein